MSYVKYNRREFINDKDSHFTGSIVCFDGKNVINQGKVLPRYTFAEIASCHAKVRLHRDDNQPMSAFIDKIRHVEQELRFFADYLERSIED
jgi:hypothetical protein